MKYHFNKVARGVVSSLVDIVGEKNVITAEGRENYARDETTGIKPVLPEVVVKPDNTTAVSQIMKLAAEKQIPVTPRGAGTGLSGGAVPIYGGITLSLERMNKIREIDRDNFTATAEAGVTLTDLYAAVAEQGLYYPPSPGEKSATVGGTVATNAGGMKAVKYGVTRHFVLGLEAVLPTGEIINTGGKFVKCSTGYDLTQLITGCEGTLAVITSVTLRLSTPPGKSEILFIPFHNLHDAINTVPEILREGIFPVGIEFMERSIVNMVEKFTGKELPFHDYDAYLMIFVEADTEENVHRMANEVGAICLKRGAIDIYLPGSERAKRNLVEAREKFHPALVHNGILALADVVVPRSRIADFVEQANAIASKYEMALIASGHAGDGNVHLHLMGEQTEANRETAEKILREIYILGASMGGTISGEHGLGFAKKGYLPLAESAAKIELMKRIKRAFDPHNILNPGKVIDL